MSHFFIRQVWLRCNLLSVAQTLVVQGLRSKNKHLTVNCHIFDSYVTVVSAERSCLLHSM